ncbi:MAG: helix-turn-helix transcriptional regulator [Lachnospiraceae bacterium]|nr:helix-turn-helix transcriptional regulator [Lachnospiraceae bacterium]
MPMNTVIQERRRALGLTQEQVADHLGVSIPAVSKWEKGITSPDLGLLPSLARLLKVDLNTLFCFNEDLSPQEIGEFSNQLAVLGRNDILAAFELAETKIHEYPHNEQLLLNIAIILDSQLLQKTDTAIPVTALDEKIAFWYSKLSSSKDDKVSNSANYMRVSRYIRQEKLDAAQEVLDTMEDKNEIVSALPDKQMLQVSIHLKQGKSEQAALELEQVLFKETSRVQMLLFKLIDAEIASGRTDTAAVIAEKAGAMVDVFDMWKYGKYAPHYAIASSEKDADKALRILEQMLDAMFVSWKLNDSALYHRMAPATKELEAKELLSIILEELETDPECDYLRTHPKYHELMAKYK